MYPTTTMFYHLKKEEHDSCFLNIPWNIGSQGIFMSPTSTLPLSDFPYSLIMEIARGKVNQFRNFNADWEFSGLKINKDLRDQLSNSTLEFGKAFSNTSLPFKKNVSKMLSNLLTRVLIL